MQTEEQNIAVTEVAPEATAEDQAVKKVKSSKSLKARRKAKVERQVGHGKAYVQATYNNTIVTLTDLNGNALAWSSAGSSGFKGPKKATPYAASLVVRNALEKASKYGLKEVNLFIRGVGQGREGAIRAFNTQGVSVLSIKDITPIPHNGCRPPRPRRV
ncbi:30S ribosomal protein S11 [Patescibacteria group bacterium]|nr:30S ribosomal protein S11 [Patescibacteria group bacterium]MBU1034626.1 30S ribosomal protein S11 [Patescibacteria group bacterium]MBU1630037.1 30S ribosomal protein S11 [Patescibacteria group bacterium]MBU1908242.1 30S ribosomal protein S11 [Patescibacteria group bacterium]